MCNSDALALFGSKLAIAWRTAHLYIKAGQSDDGAKSSHIYPLFSLWCNTFFRILAAEAINFADQRSSIFQQLSRRLRELAESIEDFLGAAVPPARL
jgi:hypothetical protein